MTLEAQLKEAELKALESAYKLGIAQEENRQFRLALIEIMNSIDASYMRSVAMEAMRQKTREPDITITCRSVMGEEPVQDVKRAMESLIPTKYRIIQHHYENGTHTLTYRRS